MTGLSNNPMQTIPSFSVLNVRVHAVQIPDVIDRIQQWILEGKRSHFIAVTGMHGVTVAYENAQFRHILNTADLVVPDGMPLVWLGRRKGYPLKRRVYGPELMATFCQMTGSRYRHYLYGGMPGIADQLARVLRTKYNAQVVGVYSPPFRPLTQTEQQEVVAHIRLAHPDIVWVGISTPKQEQWMYEYRELLSVPVLIGVGAAFDILSGRVSEAPRWMQENGLQWLHRLLCEPRRLWRRYLVGGSKFVWWVLREEIFHRTVQ
jgi:N-acetylglucosaminyldiphosphoundecaprenol N-acetyl-beta-D-mannosaminyltransferase